MNKDDLLELCYDDFIREIVNEYRNGDITDWDDMENLVREYSFEYEYEFKDLLILLYEELNKWGL